jgi:cytochrome c peroxidase
MTRILCGFLLVLVFVLNAAALSSARGAAKSTLKLPATPYRYANVELPAHFKQPGANHDNTPPDNPLTDDGATLGRVLFYDTRLSANNTTSCGSCHVQAHAFADPKPSSKGFHGGLTDRRAMPLVNLRYYPRARFFWDERAGNLEEMVLLPIQNRLEMGQDLKQVVDTLARDATYPGLFARAFGDRQITEPRIGRALAQFVRSIVSYQSRYDDGRARAQSAHDDFDNFTLQENRGKAIFMRNCSSCHMKDGNEHFFVPTPANTGLRGNDPTADSGVGDVTLRFADLGSFKSPSLRNVEVTAPYGHDGRFATLDALIDHYSDNAILDPNIGYMIPVGPLKYTTSEKTALIAFLNALTDRTLLADPRFSNPFVKHAAPALAEGIRPAVLITATPPPSAPSPPPPPPPSPLGVITERLMSFDANKDRRVSRDELPDRMQGLIVRGDRNADIALDSDEIRALVIGASSERTRVLFRPKLFDGLPGVISDMRLSPEKQERALAIVAAHKPVRSANEPIDSEIYKAMRSLLDDEEYGNFVAAAERLSKTAHISTGIVAGVAGGVVGGAVGGVVVR